MKHGARYKTIHINDYGREQWNKHVQKHNDGRPYALDWYLDIVTKNNWKIVIDTASQNMMPIPFFKKLSIFDTISRPVICQQLGPLFPEKNSDHWIDYLIKNYRFRNYPLHENSQLNHPWHRNRTNLTLDLNKTDLIKHFHKSLRKRLRKCEKTLSTSSPISTNQVLNDFIINMADVITVKPADKLIIKTLLKELDRRNLLLLKSITLEGTTLASGVFIKTDRRIINILGSSTEIGKEKDAMHYLLYHVMDQFAGQDLIFDFEGSDIKGVKDFFMQFNPQVRNYPYIEKK